MREILKKSRRIVIKAGTSILTGKDGKISSRNLERLGLDILALRKQKKEVVLVSSGAIAFGMEAINHTDRPKEMPELQACAAIGQGRMMHAYEKFFSAKKVLTAQILLTRDGLEARPRFLAARRTFQELFARKVLPIVNENDTVTTEEIAFGDNDILSVHVAHLVGADLLVILSDVDGFYLKDGSRIRNVESEAEIDGKLVRHLRDTRKAKTVGGMRAKLKAAHVSMGLGLPLMIVNGHEAGIVEKALKGQDVGTLFFPSGEGKSARKKWIAYSAARCGALRLDDGAFEALRGKNKSLLASGIMKASGSFQRGDVVELESKEGCVFGRGVVRYSSAELEKISGKKSHEIQEILGYKLQDEVIHRNDLVIWG